MPRLIAALRRCDLTADGTKFLSLKNYFSVNLYPEKPGFPVFCEKVVKLKTASVQFFSLEFKPYRKQK